MGVLARFRTWLDPYRVERVALERELVSERFRCPHDDYLCDRYGCPDDPGWKGDRA